jgi:hypothetical protein
MNCYHLGVRRFSANRNSSELCLDLYGILGPYLGVPRTNFASGCAITGFAPEQSGGALMPMHFASQQL